MVLVVGTHDEIAPAEGSREVIHESHVVEVVVICTGPERENVLERPREIVPAVSVDGLEKTENDPDVHGEDVKVASAKDIKDRTGDRSSTKNQNLGWVGVFSGETKRS